ncbi:hypothetical protein B0J12DRAFT_733311 [Macrophomina phaseolina]|uniref:Uncharacterized protein n=1 Tax=Macrophomina phaseolina TaxID=35725 RepID=A0ABQ8FV20_9PEZI|nr:hypothetical protein B0J12DRAFT_733311 [Macrophomina phaseolina]
MLLAAARLAPIGPATWSLAVTSPMRNMRSILTGVLVVFHAAEAQRSHQRSIERNYLYFSQNVDGKKGLYRRPIKEFTWRKFLKKQEVFDAIAQAHYDTAHGGKYTFKVTEVSGDITL